jgi:ABC-type transporter Mla MlaB component
MREKTHQQGGRAAARVTLVHKGAGLDAHLRICGRIWSLDVEELAATAERLLEDHSQAAASCDVGDVVAPDAAAVDLLARIGLAARQLGISFTLDNVSPELDELLCVCGLRDVLR